jgi:hypothetical protein
VRIATVWLYGTQKARKHIAVREETARHLAQQDILRRFGQAVLERAGFTPEATGRAATSLFKAGLPLGEAEQAVHLAMQDAAQAFRAALLRHATELASDSENTDTGRLHKVN